MSRLSDRINEAVELHRDIAGRCDLHTVVSAVKPTLDEEERNILLDEALHKRAKEAATRGVAAITKQAATQAEFPFPEIRRAYALDTDGRFIKNTEDLSRLEFERIIRIREEQLVADRRHLDELRRAMRAVAPFWDRFPDKTFGAICELFLTNTVAAQ